MLTPQATEHFDSMLLNPQNSTAVSGRSSASVLTPQAIEHFDSMLLTLRIVPAHFVKCSVSEIGAHFVKCSLSEIGSHFVNCSQSRQAERSPFLNGRENQYSGGGEWWWE